MSIFFAFQPTIHRRNGNMARHTYIHDTLFILKNLLKLMPTELARIDRTSKGII